MKDLSTGYKVLKLQRQSCQNLFLKSSHILIRDWNNKIKRFRKNRFNKIGKSKQSFWMSSRNFSSCFFLLLTFKLLHKIFSPDGKWKYFRIHKSNWKSEDKPLKWANNMQESSITRLIDLMDILIFMYSHISLTFHSIHNFTRCCHF